MDLTEYNRRNAITARNILMGALAVFASAAVMSALAFVRFLLLDRELRGLDLADRNFLGVYSLLLLAFIVLFGGFYLYLIIFHKAIARRNNQVGALFFIFSASFSVCLLLGSLSILAMPVTLAVVLYALETDVRRSMPAAFFMAAAYVTAMLFKAYLSPGAAAFALREGAYVTVVTLVGGAVTATLLSREITRLRLIIYTLLSGLIYIPLYFLVSASPEFATGEIIGRDFAWAAAGLLLTPVLMLMLQPLIDWLFNLTSVVRLVEICSMGHPLLKRMQAEAPGTYHHCMTVAGLAEECAAAIGENRYLARAAGCFHDVGKLEAPDFFSENQGDGDNPHDEIGPEISCDIIRAHTWRGTDFCKKYRIPAEIASVAAEHHGTLPIYYFYAKAIELSDTEYLEMPQYIYTGMLPQTKINAIVMICDGAEAALRAGGKTDIATVHKKVDEIISMRVNSRQFEECPITFRDLSVIRDVIAEVFCGLRHKRVRYDGKKLK